MLKGLLGASLAAALLLGGAVYADDAVYAAKGGFMKKPGRIAPQSDKEVTAYRKTYFVTAQKLSSAGKNREACAVLQKLLDEMIALSGRISFEEWTQNYGRFYQETVQLQSSYRDLYESARQKKLAGLGESRLASRKASLSYNPKVKKKTALPVKGSLSADGELIICDIASNSPMVSGERVIAFYSASSGEKLFEELPVPDDRDNPQINRWGRNYRITKPLWSPDGSAYAYILNGSLCLSPRVGGKPRLFSDIPDNMDVNDEDFAWSPAGDRIVYVRKARGGAPSLFWKSLAGGREKPVGTGTAACFSDDGSRILYTQDGKIFLHTVGSEKSAALTAGERALFSPDGSAAAVVRKNGQVIQKDLKSGAEKELFPPDTGAPVSAVYLCRNTVLCSRDGKILVSVNGGKPYALADGIGSFMKGWLGAADAFATEKELFLLEK